ncbi:hypothetical protein DT075_16505 [Bacillus licheniformis]|nr:hypothetical protein DT075_16505 [Bacillus licheniformis]
MLQSFYTFASAAKEGNGEPFKKKPEETGTSLSELAKTYTEKTKTLLVTFRKYVKAVRKVLQDRC